MVMKLYRTGVFHTAGRLGFDPELAELGPEMIHHRRHPHHFHFRRVRQRCFSVNLDIRNARFVAWF